MQSKTSCFNRTLYLKNITRFWPIWTGYTLFWLFALPLNFLMGLRYNSQKDIIRFAQQDVLNTVSGVVITALIFAVFAAMAVFSYLYNHRSVSMLHSLPIRRGSLFLTNYLSGLTFLMVPAVFVFLCTLAAQAAAGYVDGGAACMWLVVHLLVIFFFFSFATLCAMLTGNLLALPALYGIFNFLAMAVTGMVVTLFQQFLYGYRSIDLLEDVGFSLTPTARLLQDLHLDIQWDELGNTILSLRFQGLFTALVYAFVGVLLTVGALLLYRRRHLETAGDVVAVARLKPVFKYGVALCSALILGSGIYFLFGFSYQYNPWGLLVWFLPCGALGYFVAEMLLQKSFRVFRAWKGCLAVLAVVVLGVAALRVDPFGFTRWLPDPARVERVAIRVNSTYPSDHGHFRQEELQGEDAAAVLAIHQALLPLKSEWEAGLWDRVEMAESSAALPSGLSFSYSTAESQQVQLEYTMADGKTVYRSYNFLVTEERLADPNSAVALLTKLLNRPGHAADPYGFPEKADVRIVAADLPLFHPDTLEPVNVTVPAEGLEELYAAVRSDMDAGRLGVRYLLENQERMEHCYRNDLTLGFYDPAQGDVYAKERGYTTTSEMMAAAGENMNNWQISVTLQTTATDTLACLQRLGVLDGDHALLTQAEYQAIGESQPYYD